MHTAWYLLLGGIVLSFCAVVFFVVRSWPRISPGKRVVSILLLTPHLAMNVCILVSLAYGHPQQGSAGFNAQFLCGILIVFILPLPALAGTLATVVLLVGARRTS